MITVLIIVCISALVFLAACSNKVFKKRDFFILAVAFTCAMCALSTKFDPNLPVNYKSDIYNVYLNAKWDLVRYYIQIDEFRGESWRYAIQRMINDYEPFRVGLMFLLSNTKNYFWISVLGTFITLAVCLYSMANMYFRIFGRKNVEARYIFECLIICFCAIDFIDMINTCRYVIASALFVLGLNFLFFGKNKKLHYASWMLFLSASLLHVAFWGLTLIVIFSAAFHENKYLKYLLVLWQPVIKLVGEILGKINTPITRNLGERLLNSSLIYSHSLNQTLYYFSLLIGAISLLVYVAKLKDEFCGDCEQKNVLTAMLCLWIGSFGTTLSTRMFMIFGLLAPIYLLPIYLGKSGVNSIRAIKIFQGCSIFLLVYHISVYKIIFVTSGATWKF